MQLYAPWYYCTVLIIATPYKIERLPDSYIQYCSYGFTTPCNTKTTVFLHSNPIPFIQLPTDATIVVRVQGRSIGPDDGPRQKGFVLLGMIVNPVTIAGWDPKDIAGTEQEALRILVTDQGAFVVIGVTKGHFEGVGLSKDNGKGLCAGSDRLGAFDARGRQCEIAHNVSWVVGIGFRGDIKGLCRSPRDFALTLFAW